MSNIDNFKAQLRGGGARPNLFKVNMNFPSIPGIRSGTNTLASFMIKAAQLPSGVITPIEVPYRGRKLKVAGDRTYEPWTITVINDTNMQIRNAFEAWMNYINGNTSNTSGTTQFNALDYMTNIQVYQLDRSGAGADLDAPVTKGYNIVQAFPTNIGAIDLNYETNDAIEEFTVELNYQYWTSLDSGIS